MSVVYDDFTIRLHTMQDNYQLVAESNAGGETHPVTLTQMIVVAFIEIARKIRAYQLTPMEVQQQGHTLFAAVFQQEILLAYTKTLAAARSAGHGVRLLLQFNDARLHEMPWEILHDGRQYLALNPLTPIVRYVRQTEPINSRQKQPPLRVLFTSACPPAPGVTPLNIQAEEAHLRQGLETTNGRVELVVKHNISLDDLHTTLTRAQGSGTPFHIWHHAGHGGFLNKTFVLLLDENGQRQYATLDQIAPIAAACPDLALVVLNVCHGGAPDGLATQLAHLNVPLVVGFHNTVLDAHALLFAREVYATLLNSPLEATIGRLRNRLFLDNQTTNRHDWMLPILYARTRDFLFLAPDAPRPAPAAPASPARTSGTTFNIGKLKAKDLMSVDQLHVGSGAPPVLPSQSSGLEFNIEEVDVDKMLTATIATFASAEAMNEFRKSAPDTRNESEDLP